MITYYINGNTFNLKDEIKSMKPKRKDFKNWWKYNYDFKCWELEVPNSCDSNKFRNEIKLYCIEHNLRLEICEFTNSLTKSINDFDTVDGFFDYLHKSNQRPKLG
jgi:hypothetical protein